MTRTLAALLLALNLAAPALAQSGCATVEVDNVRARQGYLMLAAYGSAETFIKTPLASLRVAAGEGTKQTLQVCGLSGSEVAVVLFQDLDGDGRMARNLVGMPTEPWGASGLPATFGPSWESGRVALGGKTIAVKLTQ
jgi:uncharacterized protein (DUF2141 family)